MLSLKPTMKRILYGNIIILTLAAASISTASAILFRGSEIYPSVTVGEINVGLLDKKQAYEKVQRYLEAKTGGPLVVLSVEGEEWPLFAADISAQFDIQHLVDDAYLIAREGNPLQRMRERYIVMQYGKTIPMQMQYDPQKLNAFADKVVAKYNIQPLNASLVITNGLFSVTEHQPGRMVSKELLIDLILQSIHTGLGRIVKVPVEALPPEVVAQDLQSISQEWASYMTEFDPTSLNRTENIILAARAVNGTILKPNDVFSFNQIVGPRATEKGYKDAPVFIDGRLVLGAGGGVCQVSSTLFNAVLLANLEITERSSHYRPPLYVPLGLDATVADNALDFRFKNNTSSYLFIMSEVNDNRILVRIFGHELKERPDVHIMTINKEVLDGETIITQDPQMPLGQQVVDQQEQKGYRVTTIRVLNQYEKEINREVIAQDEFAPVAKIVRVGTKVINTPPPQQLQSNK
jgi:vancomycin resistance protein YoaR